MKQTLPEPPRPRPLSRRRRLVFGCLAVLLALIAVDAVLNVATLVVGGAFSPGDVWKRQTEIAAGEKWTVAAREEVVHPYLGYVLNRDHLDYVNEFGFARADADIPRREAGRIVIGVTGGSVALDMCTIGRDPLRRELSRHFPDREIVITCLAVQGYRQPQQVMALNYLCCLGAEFDLILNLDGFNEIALAPAEDENGAVFDLYPRGWATRFPTIEDTTELQMRIEGARIRNERAALARSLSDVPWRYSAIVRLCWAARNRWLEGRLTRMHVELAEHVIRTSKGRFALTGPPNHFTSDEQRVRLLAENWAHCSLHLNRLCGAIGARYVHALQPNQYVPDSKPYSDEEFADALISKTYAEAVAAGYPALQEQSERVRQAGIPFVDLTQVFADVPETIYSDQCCHINRRGYEMIATRLAAEIAAAFGDSPR